MMVNDIAFTNFFNGLKPFALLGGCVQNVNGLGEVCFFGIRSWVYVSFLIVWIVVTLIRVGIVIEMKGDDGE